MVDVVGDCASIGTTEIGTVTATTPQGSFRSACGLLSATNGNLGVFVRTPSDASALGGEAFEFVIDGLTPGTYEVGESRGGASLSYGRTPATTVEAIDGSITITSADGGFSGTFAFTTASGAEITNGRFDLDV